MVNVKEIPNIMKSGKMTVHIEPYIVLEIEIKESPWGIDKIQMMQDEKNDSFIGIGPDSATARVHYLQSHEDEEYRIYIALNTRKFEFLYDVFAEGVFRFLKWYAPFISEECKIKDIKAEPIMAGFFNRHTFYRIMHGQWAMEHVRLQVEGLDGDCYNEM